MKKLLIGVAVLLAIAMIVPAVSYARYKFSYHQRLYGEARKEWKQAAIIALTGQAANSAWLSNQVATVAARMAAPTSQSSDDWLSPHLILTRSGEWMLYTNICTKSDSRVHDLFIGIGFNGKWYYSTYHFCKQMVVARMNFEMDGQPEHLQQFASAYSLREFDGHSDECLNETWHWKPHKPRTTTTDLSSPP